MYHDIPEDLRRRIEPVVADHGLELVTADVARGHGAARVRVVVDTPAADGAVPIERCADVSRELETVLDASGLLPEGYTLEVSSPGLDRVLGRPKDLAAAVGAEVRIETREPVEGRRRFRGRLLRFEEGVAHLEVDGTPVSIPLERMARAKRIYEFTSADFGRPGAARGRRGRRARQAGTERA